MRVQRSQEQRKKWLADRALRRKIRYDAYKIICGGKPRCVCPGCNVEQLRQLQLDHVLENGAAHREAVKSRSELTFLRQIIKGTYDFVNYPVQARCEKCHLSRHKNGGKCRFENNPHEW